MDEAIRRLEAGEDPESLEQEMDNLFDESNMDALFGKGGLKGLKNRLSPPAHDDTLYRFE